jgi:hypothetical protein
MGHIFREYQLNIPRIGRFFSAVGAALHIATDVQAPARGALQEAAISLRYGSRPG